MPLDRSGVPRATAGTPPARRRALLAGTALLALMALSGRALAQDVTPQGSSGNAAPLDNGLSGNGTPTVPPISGALLPVTGADPNQSDLRDHLLDAFGQNPTPVTGAAANAPGWQITPSIKVTEALTDNPDQFGGFNYGLTHRSDDAITEIQPQALITGNTERVQVNLNYAPIGYVYAVHPSESDYRQVFNGNALATALPDLAYLDLRGSVSQNPVFGGEGLVSSDLLPPSQRETQSNLSATPYLTHAFGATGTLQTGLGYIYSATEAPNFLNTQNGAIPALLGYNYGSQWLATKRVFASFTTGEDFVRFQNQIDTDDNFYDGSGALRGAHRVLVTDDLSYGINRFIAALGEIGYENLDYPRSAYSFVGGVWAAGARVTPNGDSSFTFEYRHIDGITAPYAYGYYQITPALRVFGAYSQGISTFEQDQQNELLSGTNDATGALASAVFAAPLINSAQLFGSNQALSRTERATATLSYIANRDIVTVAFNHQRSSRITNLLGLPESELSSLGISLAELAAFGLLETNTNITTLTTISWHHDLRPDLSSDVLLGYNRNNVALTSNGAYSSLQYSVALNKIFTDTLTGSVEYIGRHGISGAEDYSGLQNSDTVEVSLRKSF
jgi:uncharacterized protein (PEP-CTERM system associated)